MKLLQTFLFIIFIISVFPVNSNALSLTDSRNGEVKVNSEYSTINLSDSQHAELEAHLNDMKYFDQDDGFEEQLKILHATFSILIAEELL